MKKYIMFALQRDLRSHFQRKSFSLILLFLCLADENIFRCVVFIVQASASLPQFLKLYTYLPRLKKETSTKKGSCDPGVFLATHLLRAVNLLIFF